MTSNREGGFPNFGNRWWCLEKFRCVLKPKRLRSRWMLLAVWTAVCLNVQAGSAATAFDTAAAQDPVSLGALMYRIDNAPKDSAREGSEWPTNNEFLPLREGVFRIGLSSQVHWLKLPVRNTADETQRRCLSTGSHRTADIRVFTDYRTAGGDVLWQEITPRRQEPHRGDPVCGGPLLSSQLWPIVLDGRHERTVLIRVRSLNTLTLKPRLVLPAQADAIGQKGSDLSVVAITATTLCVLILLVFSAFGAQIRRGLLAINAIAGLLWISTLDASLASRAPLSFVEHLNPYAALASGVLFATTYLLAYNGLFSGKHVFSRIDLASRLLMAVPLVALTTALVLDTAESIGALWVLIAAIPLLSLAHSWRAWKHHQPGSRLMLWTHAALLVTYLWQIADLLSLGWLPSLGGEVQIAWLVGLLLHHLMWIRLHEMDDSGIHEVDSSHHSVAALEAEVNRRTEDLRIARESAERMGALQRDFLATMSHELRTPLASVVGLCRMLGDDEALPERARKDMGTVERMAVHLLRMVDDGLAYVRQRGKEEPVMRKPVNMRFLLRDMESVSRWLSQRQDNEFTMLKVRNMPPVLHFDEQRLRQVLINLVSNAGLYCHHGQVSLGVAFKAADNESTLSWLISDSGRGMSPEEVKKVFEPFVKSRDSQGLGLGLALVKKLVEDMEGTIRVQSQIGLGTQFYISIPVSVEGESLEGICLDNQASDRQSEAGVSRPMALLPDVELDRLQLDDLRAHLRLGQLSEIEEWIKSVESAAGLSAEAERFLRKVRQAAADVDLAAIKLLIDQIDTPLS